MKTRPTPPAGIARHTFAKHLRLNAARQSRALSALRRLRRWHGPVSVRAIGLAMEDYGNA
jgi:hypothetical protein